MNHRAWTMEICNRTPIGELRNEHSALYGEWKSASLEAERLAKVNGELCDKIAELESVRIDSYTDSISGYQIFGSMESVKAVKKIVSDLRDTYREVMGENNRLCRDINEANHALKQPICVPFSDEAIEKMAEAAHNAYSQYWISKDYPKTDIPRSQHWRQWEDEGEQMRESRFVMIRAALAAGGLEPCAVPQYAPEDVAFPTEPRSDLDLSELFYKMTKYSDNDAAKPWAENKYIAAMTTIRKIVEKQTPCAVPVSAERASDDELAKLWMARISPQAAAAAVRARVEAPLLAEIKQSDEALRRVNGDYERTRAELAASQARVAELEAEMEPTGHVPRDVAGLRAKIENQRMTLRQLHEARERDAVERMTMESEFVSVTAERDKARAEVEAVKAERDGLKARNDIQAGQLRHIDGEISPLMSEVAALESELAAVKAERDHKDAGWNGAIKEWERCQGEVNRLKTELAALQQPVDPDAWKTPLELMTDNEFRTEFRGHAYDFGIWQFDPNGYRSSIAYTAEDAARAAQWLASYAAAHGCPVGLSAPVIDVLTGALSVAGEKPKLRTDRGGGCLYCAKPIPSEAVTCPHCGWDGEYPITKTPVLPTPIPTPDQVEVLARVLRDAHWEYHGLVKPADSAPEFYSACARAAFEHIGRVPVWLGPTRAQAEEKWKECQDLWDSGQEYSDWLLPLLPESAPVGVELDVTADELAAKMWGFFGAQVMAPQILDLFRSRIRPVYECKECARLKDRFSAMQEEQIAMNDKILAALESVKARAALEGE